MMKNALVILAGGKGKRFGQKIPKQFLEIGNTNFLNYFISNLDLSKFDIINISIDKKYQKTYFNHKAISEKIKITYSKPGLTRQISSFNALNNLLVLSIHNLSNLYSAINLPFRSKALSINWRSVLKVATI